MKERVLVVDDDALMLDFLVDGRGAEGYEVVQAESVSAAFREMQTSTPDVILSDYQLRDGTAFTLLDWMKSNDVRVPLIVLTGYASIDLAVQAVKNGADQFVPKPIKLEVLTTVLRRTIENNRNQQRYLASKMEQTRNERDPFLGKSKAIQDLKHAALRLAEANSPVLIQGETGTGKGVLARWIYKMGQRSERPFVDLNCAGLSRELLESELFGYQKGAFTGAVNNKIGFLEAANHGTLFLDEIGDMDGSVQPKILKVVEEKRFHRLGDVLERKVDVQILAATHRDLKKLAQEDKFRSDLYFRISTLRLVIPALRDRPEDIPLITDRLLDQLGGEMRRGPLRISDSARRVIQNYSWPGNIRELRNVLERAALLSDDGEIHRTGLELEGAPPGSPGTLKVVLQGTLAEMEEAYIRQCLEEEEGNVVKAAARLGIPRSSLYAKIKQLGL